MSLAWDEPRSKFGLHFLFVNNVKTVLTLELVTGK